MNTPLRVLVACEFSGTVRDAFNRLGHDAWSCDLLPDETGSNRHFQCDARDVLDRGWDLLMVAHPPCTRLCLSGLRWLHTPPKGRSLGEMWAELDDAADLFSTLWNAEIPRVAVENPKMHRHAQERIAGYVKPQIVQPWWFGDPAFKATGLHLRGLPELKPTNALTPPEKGTEERKRWEKIWRMPESPNRWRERSRTFQGLADAMAAQWGGEVEEMRMAA